MTADQLYGQTEVELAHQVRDGRRDMRDVAAIYGRDVAEAVAIRLERWDELQARSDATAGRLSDFSATGRYR